MGHSGVRSLAAVLAIGGIGCVWGPARTRPEPGMEVVVDFSPPRHIDVPMTDASTLAYDDVVAVDGKIDRMSGDTVWLRDVGVKTQGEWSWPNPRKALAVAGINRSATIHRASPAFVSLRGMVLGAAVVVAGIVLALFIIGPRGPDW